MSYCGECYWQGKRLKPCSTCYCGSEANYMPTQADRIRAMSDEELAEFFYLNNSTKRKEEHWLEWLQSEVEE